MKQRIAAVFLAANLGGPAFAFNFDHAGNHAPAADPTDETKLLQIVKGSDKINENLTRQKAEKEGGIRRGYETYMALIQMGFNSMPSPIRNITAWSLEQSCRDTLYRLDAEVNMDNGRTFLTLNVLSDKKQVLDHIGINPAYRNAAGVIIYQQGDISRPIDGGNYPLTRAFEGDAVITYLKAYQGDSPMARLKRFFVRGRLNLGDFIEKNQQAAGWTAFVEQRRRMEQALSPYPR